MNVLLIDGHPDLSTSTANAAILSQFEANTDWRIHHLGGRELVVADEQAALLAADLVIVQFPLYWSTFPHGLKKWIDDVFTYDFAFGPNGSKLKGKKLLFSVTAGAKASSYSEEGFNLMPFSAYQRAFEHAFVAAEMTLLDTAITFEMNADPNEGGDKDACLALAQQHADNVMSIVASLNH
ncbi:NAD(P)H-dependent oxidoreductase [Ferrimonas balearica]|uniref:NAD(P)H-dependent oxidoreductase n=1 Tax=Ferrimonas balearica TaxID=44012 RepID=UPI002D7EB89C|nr:NAD(P)H-dependent oxidoreductase [Ferrimonas balearica]MBY6018710.1 NAD(P)H-dependent oxidoreductase [Halomonas denitrificans]MBY6095910.1 NAD(P)H-dependent oxidoreductase [Ferrimonas balearica]